MARTTPATFLLAAALVAASLAPAAPGLAKVDPAESARALHLLERSVAFRTVEGNGQVPAYADYLGSVLVAAGYAPGDVVFDRLGETGTLTATWPGSDRAKKPIVLSGHMDVVEARARDWARDPFTPVIENGYLFGRGSADNKFDTSMMIATLVQLRREGFRPSRTIILALSGDEETAMATTRILANKLEGAELVLNGDAGGGLLGEDGKPIIYSLQGGEKTYADFEISTTNPGGHSSRPGKTNAIYTLALLLDRLAAYQFPAQQNALTAAYFRASAPRIPGPIGEAMKRYVANPRDADAIAVLSADPEYVGQVRTTCVPTMLAGGHARNALPQSATVSVNCRIFPGVPVESVRAKLAEIIADPAAKVVTLGNPLASPASPLRPDVLAAVRKAIELRFPGLEVVPSMEAGASDSVHFRAVGVPSYGVSGLFMKASDNFIHGLDERVPLGAIDGALLQWHSVLTDLAK